MGKTTNAVVTSRVISQTIRHGRAVNAVADFLRSRLRVPNVYLDPMGANLSRVDVLAVDASCSGDIHAVEVKMLTRPTVTKEMKLHVEVAKGLPAHFKYLAIPRNITNIAVDLGLFSPDGIGRVGILLISESGDQLPIVELAIKPERFLLDPSKSAQVERFLSKAKPDMYVRL